MRLFLRGDVWWVTYGSRPRKRASTGQHRKAEAEAYALRYIVPSITEDAAELLERAARLKERAKAERADGIPLASAFDPRRYVQIHGVKDSSAAKAGAHWQMFCRFCAARGIDSVGGLTPEICAGFVAERAPRAAQLSVLYCRQILRDCGYSETLFPPVPRRREVTHREPLTPAQIETMLRHVDGLRNMQGGRYRLRMEELSWYTRFLLYTGLRLGDAVTLTTEMVSEESGSVSRMMAKTGRIVEFPLHPALMPYISERCRAAREAGSALPVFPQLFAFQSRNPYYVTHVFQRIMRGCGFVGSPGQFCTHCLRATFATLCAEHGVPMAVIQSWLGHSSPMVTRIYARIEDLKRKREALERLPDFG